MYSIVYLLYRMSFRRQKRWWNAYILLYERIASPSEQEIVDKESVVDAEEKKTTTGTDPTSLTTDLQLVKSMSKLELGMYAITTGVNAMVPCNGIFALGV